VSKRKKIIVIAVSVTLALVLGVGGVAYAVIMPHMELGGHKLIGVGEMGYEYENFDGYWDQYEEWDTQFIVTNPNCDKDLTIEWVALIAGEDVGWKGGHRWYAEEVIFEGTPDDWYDYTDENTTGPVIEIPGNEESERGVLSPHEVWQVSIAELIAGFDDYDPEGIISGGYELSKYTLEVTWSGVPYLLWFGWAKDRPLIGWQKEKYFSYFDAGVWGGAFPGISISEAEMQVFPSRVPFKLPVD
jgi:hypothetical protein